MYKRFSYPNKATFALNSEQEKYLEELKSDISTGKIVFQFNSCSCGSNNEETFSEVDRLGIYLRYVICKECSLIRANPYMTSESIILFYKKYYEKLYHTNPGVNSMEEAFNNSYEHSTKYLIPFLGEYKNKNILMIGGRSGGVLYPFVENKNHCYLVDFDNESIEFAKSKEITAFCNDYKNVKFDKKFDLIILDGVAEHFLNIKLELEYLIALLSDNGKIVIGVPDASKLDTVYNFADARKEFMLCHSYLFSIHSLSLLVKNLGLNFIKSDYQVLPHYLIALFEKNNTVSKGEFKNIGLYRAQMEHLLVSEIKFYFFKFIMFEEIKIKLAPKLKENKIIKYIYRKLFFS